MIRALIDLLVSSYGRGELHRVETIAHSILASIPDDHVSLQFLGLVYYRTGRIADAIGIFGRVGRRKRRLSETKRRLGAAYLSRRDYAAATACYAEATRRDPSFARLWYDTGIALTELGQRELAKAAFRSACKAQPEFPEALLALGALGLTSGDLVTAEEGFARLRRVDEGSAEAYWGLGHVFRRRRDFSTARACYRRARALGAPATEARSRAQA